MKKLSAIIIDDEAKARRILKGLLEEYCQEVEVVAMAENVPAGVREIRAHKPDVVFLDIEMPKLSGFKLLDFFDKIDFEVIFATGYSEFAVQAFQVSALDYLLKPIQIDQLIKSVQKLVDKKQLPTNTDERVEVLKENLRNEYVTKIALPVTDGFLFVDTSEIMYLEADGSYTHIHLSKGTKVLVSKIMKYFSYLLSHPAFFQTHRSYIINLNKVKQFVRHDGGYIVMENDKAVNLTRDRREAFIQAYQELL